MSHTTLSQAMLPAHTEQVHAVSPADAILFRRLGIETLPAHETMIVPLERLSVPGAELVLRSARRLVKSIEKVGVLQPPSVMPQHGCNVHDDAVTFEVIAGRRRVLAAGMAGLSVIKCEVYASSTLSLSALLMLIENEQRTSAWVKEVEALRHLIDERVGMTMDDLAAFGFDRGQLSERLKIAQLPQPLVTLILTGKLRQEVARKLVRLTQTQQERIAAQVTTGEEITAEQVKELLRVQIDTGLAPIQSALSQSWNMPLLAERPMAADTPRAQPAEQAPEIQVPVLQNGVEAPALDCSTSPSCSASALEQVLAVLQAFEHSQEYLTLPPSVRTLATALIQQLQVIHQQTSSIEAQKGTVHHV